jgi:D-hydroxyproline dehydrogenase subunit beta
VIADFAELGPRHGYQCRWMSADEIVSRCAGVRRDGLQGGLWSDTEMVVDPRQVMRTLPRFLAETHSVQFRLGSPVMSIELPTIRTAAEEWQVERVLVCGGDDLTTLFPDVFAAAGLVRCKLQMMRTTSQPEGWRLGAALAAGLTLRFYRSFRICPSLAALEERIACEMPAYERFGIHVMASQTPAGEITIGDSHEYGDAIGIFDKAEIERLILDYLGTFLELPAPAIAERWHGTYVKHPDLPYFGVSPEPGIRLVTGLGGAGMTMSFGVAEKTWNEWL